MNLRLRFYVAWFSMPSFRDVAAGLSLVRLTNVKPSF
jgi:hypothetical protein